MRRSPIVTTPSRWCWMDRSLVLIGDYGSTRLLPERRPTGGIIRDGDVVVNSRTAVAARMRTRPKSHGGDRVWEVVRNQLVMERIIEAVAKVEPSLAKRMKTRQNVW